MLYFNKPPTPQEFLGSLFKGMAGQERAATPAAARTGGGPPPGVQTLIAGAPGGGSMAAGTGGSGKGGDVVLVTGATGGVGRRVVARLLAAGRRVRALVRDVPKAQELLSGLPAGAGGALELAAADLTQAATLQPAFFEGVGAVVCCHAVKVVPEGDTGDRSRYYQVGGPGQSTGRPGRPGCQGWVQGGCLAAVARPTLARQLGQCPECCATALGLPRLAPSAYACTLAPYAPNQPLCRASSSTTRRSRVGWGCARVQGWFRLRLRTHKGGSGGGSRARVAQAGAAFRHVGGGRQGSSRDAHPVHAPP